MRYGLLLAFFCLTATGWASEAADPRVKSMLDRLELTYEVDGDHDYKLIYDMGDDRTQAVWVISDTNTFSGLEIRELWSFVYEADRHELPAAVADRLMTASRDLIVGSYEAGDAEEGRRAVLIYRLPTDLSPATFGDALSSIAQVADEMEKELTDADEF